MYTGTGQRTTFALAYFQGRFWLRVCVCVGVCVYVDVCVVLLDAGVAVSCVGCCGIGADAKATRCRFDFATAPLASKSGKVYSSMS